MPRVFRGEPASLAFGFEAQLRAAARAARENGSAGDDSGEAQNNQAPLQPNVAAAPAPDEIQVVDAVEVEAGEDDDVTEQEEHAEEAAPEAAAPAQVQPRAQPRAIPRVRRFRHTYRCVSATASSALLTARACSQRRDQEHLQGQHSPPCTVHAQAPRVWRVEANARTGDHRRGGTKRMSSLMLTAPLKHHKSSCRSSQRISDGRLASGGGLQLWRTGNTAPAGGISPVPLFCVSRYEETRGILVVFLKNIIKDACVYCECRRAKTLTATDVVLALKRNGRVMYGFN